MARPPEKTSHLQKWGDGSIFYSPAQGRWIFQRDMPRGPDGRRRRETISRKTREELIPHLRELDRRDSVAAIDHSQDLARRAERRATAELFVARLLEIGAAEDWSAAHLASVIVASLSVRRVRLGVFGPCAYCGTWFATSVDHIVPRARGGTDDPSNLTSACNPCNTKKHARTPDEWRAA